MKNIVTTKPTKQRKKMFHAPFHIRHKHFSAPLSPDLRKTHGLNAVPVRTGDTVHIMRGDRKGFEGKVTGVDKRNYRISVEGSTREKVDGTTIFIPIHPSKVMITELNLDDKWRRESLKKKNEMKKQMVKEHPEKPPRRKITEKPIEKEVATEEKPKERAVRRKRVTRRKIAAPKKAKETKEAKGEDEVG